MQSYRQQAYHLEAELRHLRPQAYQEGLKIGQLEDRIEALTADNATVKQRLADLTDKLASQPSGQSDPRFRQGQCSAEAKETSETQARP